MQLKQKQADITTVRTRLHNLDPGEIFEQDGSTLIKATLAGRLREAVSAHPEMKEDNYGLVLVTGKIYAMKPDHMVKPVTYEELVIYHPYNKTLTSLPVGTDFTFEKGTRTLFTKVKPTGFLCNSNMLTDIIARGDCLVLSQDGLISAEKGSKTVYTQF